MTSWFKEQTFKNTWKNLEQVFKRLRAAKLTLKLEKYEFFKEVVKYLGHVISADGLKPQPSKVEAIRLAPVPKTVRELQSFLGMINYYRKFIPKYSMVARPLTKLLSGKKGSHRKNDKTPIEWNEAAQEAFEKLKTELTEKIVLKFPDFTRDFILTTDASEVSIGGVLQQKDEEGNLRPLTFFNRALNSAESKYPVIEREALAVIYGLQVNRPLCLGYHVEILTDHRPLVWLLSKATPSGRIARWQTLLSEYDFNVTYLPGKENPVADFLSRMRKVE